MQGASAFDLFRERNGFLCCIGIALLGTAAFQADRWCTTRRRRLDRRRARRDDHWAVHVSESHWINFMRQQYNLRERKLLWVRDPTVPYEFGYIVGWSDYLRIYLRWWLMVDAQHFQEPSVVVLFFSSSRRRSVVCRWMNYSTTDHLVSFRTMRRTKVSVLWRLSSSWWGAWRLRRWQRGVVVKVPATSDVASNHQKRKRTITTGVGRPFTEQSHHTITLLSHTLSS